MGITRNVYVGPYLAVPSGERRELANERLYKAQDMTAELLVPGCDVWVPNVKIPRIQRDVHLHVDYVGAGHVAVEPDLMDHEMLAFRQCFALEIDLLTQDVPGWSVRWGVLWWAS